MTVTPRQMKVTGTPPPMADGSAVFYRGRWFNLSWGCYPDSRLPCLTLKERNGLQRWTVTANLGWLCEEDEMLLRDVEVHSALVGAGLLSPAYLELHFGRGVVILARLSHAGLLQLAERDENE